MPLMTPVNPFSRDLRTVHNSYACVRVRSPSIPSYLAFAALGEGAFDFFAEVGVVHRSAAVLAAPSDLGIIDLLRWDSLEVESLDVVIEQERPGGASSAANRPEMPPLRA
jgi:hypothetical protein